MKRLQICLFIVYSVCFLACNNRENYEISEEKGYRDNQKDIGQYEQEHPAKFLIVIAKNRKNVFGQTVVKGSIGNTAKVVTFKDVELKIKFYSKTGALLEEDVETIFETIAPGGTKNFRTKLFTRKGTDSVSIQVMSAKYD